MNLQRSHTRTLAIIVLFAWTMFAYAAITTFEFDDPAKQKRYKQFSEELRCLVCQNQTIADSNAELAQDLRRELYRMINNNASDEEIKEYMVSRYGDFVLYRPPVKLTTLFLWFGPFLLVVIGLVALYRMIRKEATTQTPEISEEQRQRLDKLLQDDKEEK